MGNSCVLWLVSDVLDKQPADYTRFPAEITAIWQVTLNNSRLTCTRVGWLAAIKARQKVNQDKAARLPITDCLLPFASCINNNKINCLSAFSTQFFTQKIRKNACRLQKENENAWQIARVVRVIIKVHNNKRHNKTRHTTAVGGKGRGMGIDGSAASDVAATTGSKNWQRLLPI